VIVALAGLCWLLLPSGMPARWVGALALLPLFWAIAPGPRPGTVRIAVLDVGQGLAVVVRTQNEALLYDAGPVYSSDADSGNRIVVPYLRASGIRRLSGVIVSHADNDHAGGMGSVMAAVPIEWMTSSLPGDHPLHDGVRISTHCYAGQSWVWDGVLFEILHPAWESHGVARMKANDRSCVLRITANGERVLLSGDVEARAERAMLDRDRARLASGILLAPHHGSTTSSTQAFIEAVGPHTVIFTVGYSNRFGHPRAEILERYVDRSSRILRSDRDGAILLELAPEGARIATHRAHHRRYWHQRFSAS
jgi:competence protein ComEC